MRILQLSDLHLEFQRHNWQDFIHHLNPDVDVVALAGDIAVGRGLPAVLSEFAKHFADAHVLYVPGNHEYYGNRFETIHDHIRTVEDEFDNFEWLNAESVVTIDGQRFLGHTLWYLDSIQTRRVWERSANPGGAGWGEFGAYTWSDFEHIIDSSEIFTEAARANAWLRENVQKDDIVITHMLPSDQCVTDRWKGERTNIFFVHDLTDLILEAKPRIWMHGHTHDSTCHKIGNTEIHCNPRGYYPRMLNPDFDANLVHVI